MSDDTKQELDNFGVWVKTPPRTVDSEAAGASDAAADLPDFDSLDIPAAADSADIGTFEDGDTALSLSELSAIAQSSMITEEPAASETADAPAPSDGTEEVSLDEFITGGVFEGDTDASAASGTAAPVPAEESVDISEFGVDAGDSDAAESSAEVTASTPAAAADDGPLDIDLSFDDGDAGASTASAAPADNGDGMESVDLSEFGLGDDGEPQTASANDTQDVTAEFADMFDDMRKESADGAGAEPAADGGNGMEEVDLSEFGFDDSAEAGSESASSAPADTAEEEFSVSLDDDDDGTQTPSVAETDDESVSLAAAEPTAEDAVTFEEPATDADESAPAQREAATQPAAPQQADTTSGISAATTEILQQIVGELHSLKTEIANLKNDFEHMKNQGAEAAVAPAASDSESQQEAVPTVEDVIASTDGDNADDSEIPDFTALDDTQDDADVADSAGTGGFFDDDDGDDTIALSLDELGNILNTADFTEEAAEASATGVSQADGEAAPADADDSVFGNIDDNVQIPEQEYEQSSDLQMDFSENELEEPEIASLDAGSEATDEQSLPAEIAVPKVDDVIVESEQTDFIDNDEAAAEPAADSLTEDKLNYLAEEPTNAEVMPDAVDDSQELDTSILDTEVPVTEAEAEPVSEATEAPATPEQGEEEPSIDPVPVTDDIGTIEVELPAGEAAPAEAQASVPEADASPAPAVEATAEAPSEAAHDGAGSVQDIPSDLRQEIKSVLSYMDQLLENLPEDKIAEFAKSDQFETYKKLFKELGLA